MKSIFIFPWFLVTNIFWVIKVRKCLTLQFTTDVNSRCTFLLPYGGGLGGGTLASGHRLLLQPLAPLSLGEERVPHPLIPGHFRWVPQSEAIPPIQDWGTPTQEDWATPARTRVPSPSKISLMFLLFLDA